jgi:hypothetical protein
MKPTELLERAFSDGVQVSLNGAGKIKLTGNESAVKEWLPEIREHKQELVRLLSGEPARTWIPGNPFTCSCGFSTGWRLNGEALCPACFYHRQNVPGQNPACDQPDHGAPPRQINCQAFEHNGVMMSTSSVHCRQWQGPYCQGCTLLTTIQNRKFS